MADLNRDNGLDKLTLSFVTIMSVIMLLSMGADLHEKDYFALATSGVSVAFFLGLAVLVINLRWRELKDRVTAAERDVASMRVNKVAEAPARPEVPEELKKVLGEMMEAVGPAIAEAKEHARDHEMLQAIIEDTGGTPISSDRIPKIEAAYHENTNKFVKLTLVEDNSGIEVEFSDTPIEAVPADTTTKGNGTTLDGVKKPLTKSQQRRLNSQKGLGAITDDEVREQRNEARRQKRAAKKAEAEKTTITTTTQPGQTTLPVDN